MKIYLLPLFALSLMGNLRSQPTAVLAAFKAATFADTTNGHPLPYRVLWPLGYEKEEEHTYPLVLFLHGAGERGNDNGLQLTHGASLFLNHQTAFPAIVLMPQCATEDYWAQMVETEDGRRAYNFDEQPNPSLTAVQNLLHHFLEHERVDAERVYLMGLSMGGMGTFELLARGPEIFAAAVPICGGTNPKLVGLYAHDVPLWIFHGDADQVVTVDNSRRVVEQLAHLGITPRYTEYAGVGHNSWDRAFAEAELLEWLFGRRRGER